MIEVICMCACFIIGFLFGYKAGIYKNSKGDKNNEML